jgi:hypothetical protein
MRHAYADFRLRDWFGVAFERRRASRQEEGALHQVTDDRRRETHFLHCRRRTQSDFPAKGLLTGGNACTPLRKLRAHAFFYERGVPRVHLWLSGCTS